MRTVFFRIQGAFRVSSEFEGIKRDGVELEKAEDEMSLDEWESKQSVISFFEEDNFSLCKTIKKTNLLDLLSFYETWFAN